MLQLIQHKKAQVAVLDLFIAAMIFGIMVATIMAAWNSYNIKIEEKIENNDDILRAYHVSDLLVRYPGRPSYWELNSGLSSDPVDTIGLAEKDGVIDPTKLAVFFNFSDDYIKNKLKIKGYEYYFRLAYINDTDFDPPVIKGEKINDSETIISIRRFALYNGTEVILEIQLQK